MVTQDLTLPEPDLDWRGGVPVSAAHGDIYFSERDGLAESRHVFLGGVGAPALWRDRSGIVIGEIGFGTGLNFLATWAAWRDRPGGGPLHYLAVEGAPLRAGDLARALAPFGELTPLAEALAAQYPPAFPGLHRLSFEGGMVQLSLAFGEAGAILPRLEAAVDAWYLDGFAPARNPQAWRPAMLREVARLSRPHARLATFTAASTVRGNLEAAGFRLEKRPGFAGKRECLAGGYAGSVSDASPRGQKPWFDLPTPTGGPVAIIGGGIAAAWCARACRAEGLPVKIVAPRQSDPLPAAVLAPRINIGAHGPARFGIQAMLQAWRSYDALADAWTGPRGVLQLLGPDKGVAWGETALRKLAWPNRLLRWVEAEAAAICGAHTAGPALAWPQAGCVDAGAVLAALMDGIPRAAAEAADIAPLVEGWVVRDADGNPLAEAASVIVAAGPGSAPLLGPDAPPLTYRRGQLSYLAPAKQPEMTVSFGGTLTASLPAADGARLLGSTFQAVDSPVEAAAPPRERDHGANHRLLARALPELAESLSASSHGWAGLRVATRDHMPVAGPVADMATAASAYAPAGADWKRPGLPPAPYRPGLYVLTGLGARGFQTAPLLGAVLAATQPAPAGLPPAVILPLDAGEAAQQQPHHRDAGDRDAGQRAGQREQGVRIVQDIVSEHVGVS